MTTSHSKNVLVRKVNEMYSIYSGPAELQDRGKDEDKFEGIVYKVINDETGVLEVETTVFPKAISAAIGLYNWTKSLDTGEATAIPDFLLNDEDEEVVIN